MDEENFGLGDFLGGLEGAYTSYTQQQIAAQNASSAQQAAAAAAANNNASVASANSTKKIVIYGAIALAVLIVIFAIFKRK